MSSIIAPSSDIDPLIFLFSTLTLLTLDIALLLSIFFEGLTSSIEGEGDSSFFII